MWNHNNNNNNGANQGNNNDSSNNQNNSAVPNPTAQDLQLFLSCLHQVAVAQISQWHDSLQATFSARGVGSSNNNNSNNRTNNNNPQQNNSAKAKTSGRSATTKKENRKERKERKESSDSSSSSSSDSESEDLIWVDGDKEVEVPKKQLKENGSPYFGWAFCLVSTKKNKVNAVTKSYHCCMGCFSCPEENCTFLARPLWPSIKWMGAPPKAPKRQCVVHKCDLVWIPCTGNSPLTTKTGDPMPCTLTVTIPDGKSQSVTAIHKGNHDSHPRPPEHKPSPAAMKALTKIVKTNPEAGPAKLIMGTRTRSSVASLSKAFHNIDRLGHKRRQIVHKNLRAFGIRGSIGGLFEMSADFPTDFIVECSFKDGIISLQSDYMRQVLNDAAGGLQSDTVEGVINELEYNKGSLDIHFTSAFDQYQDRWVPVLISIIFGRKAEVFSAHWMTLLKSYDDIKTWEEFKDIYPGTTIDWSSALGKAICKTLVEFAKRELGKVLLEEETYSFVRKFQRKKKRSFVNW